MNRQTVERKGRNKKTMQRPAPYQTVGTEIERVEKKKTLIKRALSRQGGKRILGGGGRREACVMT